MRAGADTEYIYCQTGLNKVVFSTLKLFKGKIKGEN